MTFTRTGASELPQESRGLVTEIQEEEEEERDEERWKRRSHGCESTAAATATSLKRSVEKLNKYWEFKVTVI